MARPRRVTVSTTRQELRNATARAKGYRSDYDYRIHDYGRIPATEKIQGGQLKRARGHVGPEALVRELREGDIITLIDGVGAIEIAARLTGYRTVTERRRVYRTLHTFQRKVPVLEQVYVLIRKRVLSSRTGRAREYDLRNLTRPELISLIEREIAAGGTFSPAPSLDQRRILKDDQVDGGY
jgi:hypothetical protein